MKKSFFFSILFVGVILLSLLSCKKGENDPFFSLKSRTGRLTNDWKLVSEDYAFKESFHDSSAAIVDGSSTVNFTFDGSNAIMTTATYGQDTNVVKNSYPYSSELQINKDGTYKNIISNNGASSTEIGNWIWENKNKSQDLKNKEAVTFFPTSNTDGVYFGKTIYPKETYVIDKLTSKELVIKTHSTFSIGKYLSSYYYSKELTCTLVFN